MNVPNKAIRTYTLLPGSNASIQKHKEEVKVSVVLVGAQGHGKSTFANYLHNYGQEEIFKTSMGMSSCTKAVQSMQIQYETQDNIINFTIVDTPGLNDEDDFVQMREVVQTVNTLDTISAVIICMNYRQRNDINFKATIRYYRQLLKPLFDQKNVILVCTQIDNDTYLDLIDQKDKWVAERRQNFENEGIEIDFVELINSKPRADTVNQMKEYLANSVPPSKIERMKSYLEGIKNISTTNNDISPPPEHLVIHLASRDARKRIMGLVVKFKPVSLKNHNFPLPPQIDLTRERKVELYETERNQLVLTVEKEDDLLNRLLNDLRKVEKEMKEVVDQLSVKYNTVAEWSGPRKSPPIQKFGNDIFYFGRIKNETLTAPCNKFEISVVAHNCTYVEVERRNCMLVFDIVPDFINVRKMKHSRWSLCIWIEWQGLEEGKNKEKIKELSNEILYLESKREELQKNVSSLNGTISGSKIQQWKDRVNELSGLINFLNRKFFRLEETERLFKELTLK